jgi:hypothetical protein
VHDHLTCLLLGLQGHIFMNSLIYITCKQHSVHSTGFSISPAELRRAKNNVLVITDAQTESACSQLFITRPHCVHHTVINPLTPNDPYRGRTAPLTSKRCTLYIYSTNIDTEYFKHGIYSPFFFSSKCNLFHNSNVFGSCIIHILYTGCAKIKKNHSGAKRLKK